MAEENPASDRPPLALGYPGLRSDRPFGLRLKLMVYFLVILVIPLVTLGFVGPAFYAKSIERETTSNMSGMISQVNMNIELRVREMEQLIDLLSQTRVVASFLEEGSATGATRQDIVETLRAVSGTHPEIAGIIVVADDDAWVGEGFSRSTRDPLTEEQWYTAAREAPAEVKLIARPIGRNIRSTRRYGADEVVSVVKAVVGATDGRFRGAVLIDLRLSKIEELFNGSSLGKGGFLFIVDSTGEMVYTPVNRVAYRIPPEALSGETPSSLLTLSGTDYQVLSQRSPYTGWRTFGVFSLAETLREVTMIRLWTLIIGGLTMVLAVAAAFFFASSIAKPVLGLRSLMKRVEHGDLSVRFSGAPNDEIGELGFGFNEMIGRIQSLIGQVYSEQQSKRDAELRILQEQIKPHFLYNTLDTIQWMAQEGRVGDVVRMVGALTSLFRMGLSKGHEFIPLSDEIEHVESYLCIQKMRYEDKFDYVIDCEKALRPRRVLRLLLQPLVENAIYHGIKERRGHGSLAVGMRIEAGDLFLTVRDDGVGMDAMKVALLNESLEEGKPLAGGYGIRNVHERIRLTYGRPYGLHFRSSYGEGTEVTVRHPLLDLED
jgi:two-component system sensor histidine kinase YesM